MSLSRPLKEKHRILFLSHDQPDFSCFNLWKADVLIGHVVNRFSPSPSKRWESAGALLRPSHADLLLFWSHISVFA